MSKKISELTEITELYDADEFAVVQQNETKKIKYQELKNLITQVLIENNIIDNLESTATDKALSANKGKELNEKINKSNVLWEGVILLKSGQSVNLSENITSQKSGIVLVWSPWNGTSAEDWGFQFSYFPKKFVELMSGKGCDFHILGNGFTNNTVKYVYISDNKITGHTSNVDTGTKNGITYDNSKYVLRYVLGV